MTDSLGDNLIFLISQPRAGSTLLQRVLGSHSDVHTISEPWLMLHPLYALRRQGHTAEYNVKWAHSAMSTFVKALPEGEQTYLAGLRRMYGYLYDCLLKDTGKRLFLDKTPRYYLIMPELAQVFPDAHYIILIRNPLAVLCSILETWVKGDWYSLYNYKEDLLQAPHLLNQAPQVLGPGCITIQYEQLVVNAETQVCHLCEQLSIPFEPVMIHYGQANLPQWTFGDEKSVYQHAQPIAAPVDKWVQALENPQVWRLVRDYLARLGQDTIQALGYSYPELVEILEARRPSRLSLLGTFSLTYLLSAPLEERSLILRLCKAVEERGTRAVAKAVTRRLRYALSKHS